MLFRWLEEVLDPKVRAKVFCSSKVIHIQNVMLGITLKSRKRPIKTLVAKPFAFCLRTPKSLPKKNLKRLSQYSWQTTGSATKRFSFPHTPIRARSFRKSTCADARSLIKRLKNEKQPEAKPASLVNWINIYKVETWTWREHKGETRAKESLK